MLYLRLLFGDVISLAVIRMRISTIVRVLSQAISCWICRGWSRTVVGYCPRIFPFVYRENCLEIKILKWYIYKFPYKQYTHTHTHIPELCVISGFRREVNENCALLGCYATISGNFVPTFRENLPVSSSEIKNPKRALKTGPTECSEASVRNHHYSLRNNTEVRCSHLWTPTQYPPPNLHYNVTWRYIIWYYH